MGCRYYCDRLRREFSAAPSRHWRNSRLRILPFGLLLSFLCSSRLHAQSIPIELGVQLTGTHLHKLDQTPLGIGGRSFFEFARGTSSDAEITYFSNLGVTSALFGIKSGLRSNRFGLFGKTRAGIWHFSGAYFDARLHRNRRQGRRNGFHEVLLLLLNCHQLCAGLIEFRSNSSIIAGEFHFLLLPAFMNSDLENHSDLFRQPIARFEIKA